MSIKFCCICTIIAWASVEWRKQGFDTVYTTRCFPFLTQYCYFSDISIEKGSVDVYQKEQRSASTSANVERYHLFSSKRPRVEELEQRDTDDGRCPVVYLNYELCTLISLHP